ncbi:putative transporter ESBP6 [Grifola frondosa]|uniref:Putative transporter ESBP6 n=1 Tax=Grifola frondosa TaxID=5627 RepID=A0A1C7MLV5_GRIFR|nr:putative transporter ESBP6 [Grifola frondosa]
MNYYTSHPPFNKSSGITIAAVGTVSLAIQYGEVWQLILLQGIGVGVGGGLLYMPVIFLLPQWFSRRRGLAGGIIFAGTGVGENVGLRWTLRVWAIGTSIVIGIALLGMRRRVPVPKYQPGMRRPRFIPPQMQFLKTPLFWSFSITTVLQGLSYFPVSLYIASFTKAISTSLSATVVLSLFNSSAVVGQIVMGHLSDRFPYPWIMVFSALGSGLAAFLLWGFSEAVGQIYAFVVIFGALSGGFSSMWPAAAADCAGSHPELVGVTFSCTALVKGISAVVGPILAGVLLEAGKSSSMGGVYGRLGYGAVEIFVGSTAIASAVGSTAVAITRQSVMK